MDKQVASIVDTQVLRDAFEVNFFGVVEVCKAFVPLLRKSSLPGSKTFEYFSLISDQ
jgi:NAD(P)-dependent dehydrogenase (short-subunit alcohol dehydrogenase family)